MDTIFNPNELVLEKVRSVEEYDPETNELSGRYTQIESPSLKTTAEGREVTDAIGASIMTFYNAQKGTFDFTNSLFSLDLAVSQFGTEKKIAEDGNKILMPVSETITVATDHTVTLKYIPIGLEGAEIKYVKLINGDNSFGKTYEISPSPAEGKFTLDAENKKITLPDDVTGRVFVNYMRETSKAVSVAKSSDSEPRVVSLLINCIFHNPCNKNIVYAGVISCPRAQIDPSNVELLGNDGKHGASYVLQTPYCDPDAKLFEIMVSED